MLILASQSPRRRDLLTMLGLDFTIITADIDETMDPALSVEDAVADVCRRKAAAVRTSRGSLPPLVTPAAGWAGITPKLHS